MGLMLAVVTRNELHSWRFCLPMLRARRSIREQLAATPGLIRQLTPVASPTEFFTLTVWESRQAMFNFMSAGAHESFMWMFARWSASFWSVRWLPTTAELGRWEGLSLASLITADRQVWEPPETPSLPLSGLFGSTPSARSADPRQSGVIATTVLVETANPLCRKRLLRQVRELSRDDGSPQILRSIVGFIDARRRLVLSLWQDRAEYSDAAGGYAAVVNALHSSLNAHWTMGWAAGEYEIGHWDHLRVVAQCRMVFVPMRDSCSGNT